MATKIKHKRSSISGNVPTPNQLEPGELAVNTADGKIYLRKDDNSVSDITQSIFQRNTKVLVTDTGNDGRIDNIVDGVAVFNSTIDKTTFNKEIIVNESIKLQEDPDNGQNFVQFKVPDDLSQSYTFVLPNAPATLGQTLVSDGQGGFTFEDADTFGGNRIYVSFLKGNDNNDGITAPVRTVKRGLQIASGLVYDQTFVYNEDTCRRDIELILRGIGYDLTYGGNWQSLKAGLTYYNATASAVTTTQKAVTLAALEQLKTLTLALPGITGAAETFLSNRLDEIINIFDNGVNQYNVQTYLSMPNPTGSTVDRQNAKNAILANVPYITEEVAGWINDKLVGFVYNGTTVVKCERDVTKIIKAAIYDSVLNTNYNSITAGLAYTRENSAYVLGSQNIQTRYAIKKIIELSLPYTQNTIFQTRYTNAINEVVDIFDNGALAANSLVYTNPSNASNNAINAKNQLIINKEFIKAEVVAFVTANNPPPGIDVNVCGRDTGYIVDALCYDILYGGNSASIEVATAYFVGTAPVISQAGEISATVQAFTHLASVVSNVVRGILITKTSGNALTQNNTTHLTASITEANVANSLISITINVINAASLSGLPTTQYPVITWTTAALQQDHEAISDNTAVIVEDVSNYIYTAFDQFTYDVAKCQRDIEFILRGIAYDIIYGGDSQTTDAARKYYAYGVGALVNPGEAEVSAVAYEYAHYLVKRVIMNLGPAETFSSETRVAATPVSSLETDTVNTLFNIIITGLREGPSSIPAPVLPTATENEYALRQILIQTSNLAKIKYRVVATASNYKPNSTKITVCVTAGDYEEDNPLIVPDNVTVVGDSLRSVIMRPLNPGLNMLNCRNGAYFGEFTFRDGIVGGVPVRTFDYATAFDDVNDPSIDRWTYDRLPLSKPIITQSPYIQNVSVISFMGGNGAIIDGNLVAVPNLTPGIPEEQERPVVGSIPEQGKSFVANAFTMLSFGGTGWRLINDAYAQIVSCFQIFMLNGCFAQSGGYLSVTNSATNFGIYALRASGYSPNAFVIDRGIFADVGTTGGNFQQTLTMVGMGHEAIEHYIIRVRENQVQFTGSIADDILTVSSIQIIGPGLSVGSILSAHNIRPGTTIVATAAEEPGVLTGSNGLGTYRVNYTNTTASCTIYTTHTDTAEITGNYKDVPTEYLVDAAVDINTATDIITFSTDHNLTSGDSLEYDPNGNVKIAGLDAGQTYYAEVLTPNTIRLYFDESFKVRVDFFQLGSGTHKFLSNVEELFVEQLLESHNTYQILTLNAGSYTFVRGRSIDAISGGSPVKAYVYYWDPTNYKLIVSIELVTIGSITYRSPFNDTSSSTILADHALIPTVNVSVTSVLSTTQYYTNKIKVLSTKAGSSFDNSQGLKGKVSFLHRPSIVNSSSHTWEYAGSGIDYNALPQNGGKGNVIYEQYVELPGRVYSSGTNELGDFKVGDFIVAFNRTGTITFKNQVNIAELAVIKLAFSDVVIDTISIDPDLGGNEIGGPGNNRLTTQKAIRSFITNNLGTFIGKKVSTNSEPGAVVQLNAQGQINSDLLPIPNSFQSIITEGYNSRFLEYEDIPANNLNSGDLVTEEFTQQTLTLSTNLTGSDGDVIYQASTGAYGLLKGTVTSSNTITVAKGNSLGIFGNSSNVILGSWFYTSISSYYAPPGTFNNVDQKFIGGANELLFSVTDYDGVDRTALLSTIAVGHTISIRMKNSPSRYVLYKIRSASNLISAFSFQVTYLFSFGTPVFVGSGGVTELGLYNFNSSSNYNYIFTAGSIVNLSKNLTYTVNSVASPVSSSLPYFLKKDSDSQYLVLAGGRTYDFTYNGQVNSLNGSIGRIYDYRTGVITAIALTSQGNGYTTNGVYYNVELVAGSGVFADITVSNNSVTSVDIVRGGKGYAVNSTINLPNASIGGKSAGGVQAFITVTVVESRLYVIRDSSSSSFTASSTNIDYIRDNTSSTLTIDQGGSTTSSFNTVSNVDYTNNIFTITSHGLTDGDIVTYDTNFSLPIQGLVNSTEYYVSVLTANTFQLSTNYALSSIIDIVAPVDSARTQYFIRKILSTQLESIRVANHGLDTGTAVKFLNNFYYVGSVTANNFSLHVLKSDALDSINGLTINPLNLSAATGNTNILVYDVSIISTVNTASGDANNWTVISTTDIDAGNIVSGVISTSRLAAAGYANTDTFLRGDSNWVPAVQSIREAADGPLFFLASGDSSGYYGNVEIDIERVAGDLGDAIYTNLGVARFLKDQFDVSTDGSGAVLVKDGVVDAIKLNGQPGSYYLDPTNYTGVVPSSKGGTGVNNNFAIAVGGEISTVGRLYTVSNITNQSRNLQFTLTDDTELTLPTTGTLVTTTGEQTFTNKTFINVAIEGNVSIISQGTGISLDTGFFVVVSTTNVFVVDTWDKTLYRSAKYMIQITQDNNYQVSELMVLHNGSQAQFSEYALLYNNQVLGTYTVVINTNEVRLRIQMGSSNSATIKVFKKLMNI